MDSGVVTRIDTSEYGTRTYEHHGVRIEQQGIGYRVWVDYVRPYWSQPACSSLRSAASLIEHLGYRA